MTSSRNFSKYIFIFSRRFLWICTFQSLLVFTLRNIVTLDVRVTFKGYWKWYINIKSCTYRAWMPYFETSDGIRCRAGSRWMYGSLDLQVAMSDGKCLKITPEVIDMMRKLVRLLCLPEIHLTWHRFHGLHNWQMSHVSLGILYVLTVLLVILVHWIWRLDCRVH